MISPSRTLGQLLEDLATQYAEKDALFFQDQTLSFQEWNNLSESLAKGLLDLGIRKGDRVALLMSNRTEWFIATFAAAKIGAVIVGVNTWYKANDLAYVLRQSGTKLFICQDQFLKNNYLDMLAQIIPGIEEEVDQDLNCPALPDLRRVVVLGERVPKGAVRFQNVVERGMNMEDEVLLAESPEPEDLMFILYTSGTTSRPKGVTLVHSGLIENGFHIGERQHIHDQDRLWLVIPLFFSLGSANAIMAALTHGASIVIQEHFDAGEALRLMEKHQCTIYYGMPVMTNAIYYHPDRHKHNLASLQKGVTIGSSETMRITMELVPHISNVYGSTETYGNCCVIDGTDSQARRVQSQGKPLPGVTIKIVDLETRQQLPVGQVGEVCVKGYITPGYYQDPENNKAAFDQDGYYITGDLGFLDQEGYFYYSGRIKDMIKTGGINVSPLAVEECILDHPNVKDVHVLGVPDQVKGEAIVAIIELKEKTESSEIQIMTFCREHLPSYSVPAVIEFWTADQFPRTDTGKVAKRMLREVILARAEGGVR